MASEDLTRALLELQVVAVNKVLAKEGITVASTEVASFVQRHGMATALDELRRLSASGATISRELIPYVRPTPASLLKRFAQRWFG